MSWSENRHTESKSSQEEKLIKLRQVNTVLEKLAKDEDLHDDLKMPVVKRALDHWTGRKRLSAEDAMEFQDNRRAIYVLQRLQMLQSVCYEAGIPVPLDYMLERRLLPLKAESSQSSNAKQVQPKANLKKDANNDNVETTEGENVPINMANPVAQPDFKNSESNAIRLLLIIFVILIAVCAKFFLGVYVD